MFVRIVSAPSALLVTTILLAATALAQVPPDWPSTGADDARWRAAFKSAANASGSGVETASAPTSPGAALGPGSPLGPAASPQTAQPQIFTPQQVQPVAHVTQGLDVLPNQHGQVWREYDISPYTSRVVSVERPEKAIVDWILRETGTDMWFSEPLGLLSADKNKLRVYHTPEVQRVVADVVDRFVGSGGETHAFGLHLVTLASPNWRSVALPLLKPVEVQTPGIEAWLITKENAAVLMSELGKRTDFRQYNSPQLVIPNGQMQNITRTRPRPYYRSIPASVTALGQGIPTGQLEEGFSMELSPLLSVDGRTIDAVIKCDVVQVEKLLPISIDLPTAYGQKQRMEVQVPQRAAWRLHERFRWPTDEVLLISCGVGATPGAEPTTTLGVPNPLATAPARAEALIIVESKGKAAQALIEDDRAAVGMAPGYRGRY